MSTRAVSSNCMCSIWRLYIRQCCFDSLLALRSWLINLIQRWISLLTNFVMPYHYDTRNLLWFSLQRFLHLFGKYTNRFSVVCPIAGSATARRKKPPKPIPQITRWESTRSETQLRPLHVWIVLLQDFSEPWFDLSKHYFPCRWQLTHIVSL